jgi:hypothetical protein
VGLRDARPHRCPHEATKALICRMDADEPPEMVTDDAKFALGF